MSKKKPDAIPLERVILTKGHERNLAIERNSADRDKAMLAALDAELQRNAVENLAHKDTQRVKAQKPRGASDDGRTMRDLIRAVTEWSHLQSAIVEWSGGECELLESPTRYKYTARNGKPRTITLRHFHAVRRGLGAANQ